MQANVNAATTSGSRTFDNAIVITWIPSTTEVSVVVTMSIYGAQAGQWYFDSNDTVQEFSITGDTYATSGAFVVQFGAQGNTGQLSAKGWTWTIGDTPHKYEGWIGGW